MKGTEPILKISDLLVAFERGKRRLPVIEGLNSRMPLPLSIPVCPWRRLSGIL